MSSTTLESFNKVRTGAYVKDESDEAFLETANNALREVERELYVDEPLEHPLVFVAGLPRSGTTLMSQVLAHGLDIGYVDNMAARFWRAPVHGLRFSKVMLGADKQSSFSSDYARTNELRDIHEFGYFWREWLKKGTLEDITNSVELEDSIDWAGLRGVLGAMQRELGAGIAAKNINASYHMPRISNEMGKTLWVYIERDPRDAAISIHDARQKYYGDPGVWWSYTPIEYPQIADLPWAENIAGQVHYLREYYRSFVASEPNVIEVKFEDLCGDPHGVLKRISDTVGELYDYDLGVTADNVPAEFGLRTYDDRADEQQMFADLLDRYAAGELPPAQASTQSGDDA